MIEWTTVIMKVKIPVGKRDAESLQLGIVSLQMIIPQPLIQQKERQKELIEVEA